MFGDKGKEKSDSRDKRRSDGEGKYKKKQTNKKCQASFSFRTLLIACHVVLYSRLNKLSHNVPEDTITPLLFWAALSIAVDHTNWNTHS